MNEVKLKGNPIKIEGNFPEVGVVVEDFVLVDQKLQDRHLAHFQGKKLLAIVPSLETSVCLTSAKKFNEKIERLSDVTLLYISADLPFAQERVCKEEKLKQIETLSMMRNKDFGRDYGVLMLDGPLAGLCTRAIIALDEENRVIYSELVREITKEPNYELALSAMRQ